MSNQNKIHLYDKILSPIMTEKSTNLSSLNKVSFKVPFDSNKKILKKRLSFLQGQYLQQYDYKL